VATKKVAAKKKPDDLFLLAYKNRMEQTNHEKKNDATQPF